MCACWAHGVRGGTVGSSLFVTFLVGYESRLYCRPLSNISELSRTAATALSTLRRCLTLLEATCLFQPLPARSSNLGKRLVKAPEAHLIDAGLAAHLIGFERRDAHIAGIEIKTAASVGERDFSGLDELAAIAGKKFARGAVLYLGSEVVRFGEQKWAVPVGVLWMGARVRRGFSL